MLDLRLICWVRCAWRGCRTVSGTDYSLLPTRVAAAGTGGESGGCDWASKRKVDATRFWRQSLLFRRPHVLDLARTGADVCGVASFSRPCSMPAEILRALQFRAKVALSARLMTPDGCHRCRCGVGGGAQCGGRLNCRFMPTAIRCNAFTNPAANDPGFGAVLQRDAEPALGAEALQ